MKLRLCLSLAAISIFLCSAKMETARRPGYGGTLRVEVGATVNSLDPAVAAANSEEAAAKAEIDSLIYERNGTSGAWELTGPFRISEWQPGKELALAANDDFHGGRPYLDSIVIQMGRAPHDRILDLELNRTDLAEIPPEQARRAADRGIRLSSSKPDGLLAIVFIPGRAPAEDAGVRQAIAQTLDRASLVNFILQKEGEPTDSLLPQWSSGTAFLFPLAADPAHAKELWLQIAPSPKFVLGYDAGDPLEASVAERIAVTAREVGIPLTTQAVPDVLAAGGNPAGQGGAQSVDARLVRWRMASPDAREALLGFEQELMSFGYPDPGPLPERASAEEIFEREQSILGGFRIVPIVWLPHVYGLSARVRDWTAPEPGSGWPLADVWLESEAN